MIFPDLQSRFAPAYPFAPAKLRHRLSDGPLFEIDRLLDLARSLPPQDIEYNAADLAIGCDPAAMPANGLTVEETIRTIDRCGSWMVLMRVEKDPDYRALMERCLADIAPVAEKATGALFRKEAFIFLSSPGAVTPFHMDPEHNILMQIRGAKTMNIYPYGDYSIAPPELHEAFHARGRRNLGYREAYEKSATAFELAPGEAVYAPVKAPHHVRVGDAISVSFSITWRSRWSDADARLHRMNDRLRRLGAKPSLPGAAPARDAAKIFAERLVSKWGGTARA